METTLEDRLLKLGDMESDARIRLSQISAEIQLVKEQIFYRDHPEIKIGIKVITDKDEVGFFQGITHQYGKVEPLVYKIKNDGTQSKQRLWMYNRKLKPYNL